MKHNTTFVTIITNILLFTKVIWVLLLALILERYFEHQSTIIDNYDVKKIREYIEYALKILMGILLVYVFDHSPTRDVSIDTHLNKYLYFFGIMAIFGTFYEIYKVENM